MTTEKKRRAASFAASQPRSYYGYYGSNRPAKPKERTKRLEIRATESELSGWDIAAAREKLPTATWARRVLTAAAAAKVVVVGATAAKPTKKRGRK